MDTRFIALALPTALALGCKGVDCGDGTTERNGACVPSNETVGAARCGPFTRLQGDMCVPMFPPTVCDPDSTAADPDPSTGVTTCIGTGAAGCSARLPCSSPTDSTKQTLCGQLYDFETGQAFQQSGATGAQCSAVTATGPCSIGIRAFDAVALAMNPGSTLPLPTGAVYVDDCGRFRIPEVTQPTVAPVIALSIDDVMSPGPMGSTNTVGIATGAMRNAATRDIEGFIVHPTTVAGWSGPTLAGGIFGMVFRAHSTGGELAAGVTPVRNGAPDATHSYYFGANAVTRMTLDSTAHATGVNGTALFTITAPQLTDQYSGMSTLPSGCQWESHAASAIPGVVFIQIFRPTGGTCTL